MSRNAHTRCRGRPMTLCNIRAGAVRIIMSARQRLFSAGGHGAKKFVAQLKDAPRSPKTLVFTGAALS
jgi:hypothetical protein